MKLYVCSVFNSVLPYYRMRADAAAFSELFDVVLLCPSPDGSHVTMPFPVFGSVRSACAVNWTVKTPGGGR